MALKRGEAHLAGSHLLDPESGEFNQAYVRRYLPDVPVVIMALVEREQGLILAPENPGGIQDLEDLVREGVRFVNRQRGSGTRVLLDYHLEQKGIAAAQIQGYSQEEYTHLAVAAAVASGSADAGLAIRAAAAALNLCFIPLYRERYDLILPRIHYESAKLQPLIARLSDPEFRAEVARMPGYHIDLMGTIIAETGG
jgi:putative molybdopterin biosynthesis protein